VSMENWLLESDGSLVVIAVLGDLVRGARGGVGCQGCLGGIVEVLHDRAGAGGGGRE